jgi:site-specific recombinase XerD
VAILTTPVTAESVGDLLTLIESWRRSLKAANKTDKTIATYMEAARQLLTFLAEHGMPTLVLNIRREHVEAFVERLVETRSAATANNRYRALVALFKWLEEDGEIPVSPMARMKPPTVPVVPVPVLGVEEVKRLLAACKGKDFDNVRDEAVLRLFIDTGMRLSELSQMTLDSVDLDNRVAYVVGKGRRPRACPFGAKTANLLDKYLRVRARQPGAALTDAFWIGTRGALTTAGVRALIERRARQAGIGHVHAHLFRHLAAHHAKADGVSDDDMMRLFGWKSREMLSRYAASTADERARNAYHSRPSLGDRL